MTYVKPNPFNLSMPAAPFDPSGAIAAGLVEENSHETGMPAILAGILIPHIICTAVIMARISSRILLLRKWFLDDTLILLAWSFSTAVCAVYSVAARTPGIMAAHDEAALQSNLESQGMPPGSVHPYIMRTYLGLIFYQLCLCLTKLSILAFYLRMFSSRPRERRLAWATVILVLLYGIPLLFISVFQCHPEQGQFFGRPMQCFGFAPLLIASASLHTATDAWLIVMVVPCISRLDLPPRQKIALAVVLSLSIFVIAASLVRLQLSLHHHFRPGDAGITNTLAFFVMTILECDIALMCASAPTLRPLVARMWPKLMSDPRRRRSRQPIDTESSANLTAVSYHGYPWTQPGTPTARSKNGSMASHIHLAGRTPAPATSVPVPPMPTFSPRPKTPGSLSLKSFWSTMTPRSRGRGYTGDDRPILLRGEGRTDSRPASLAFDDFFEKYTRPTEHVPGSTPRRNAISVRTAAGNLGGGENRWAESQESFVLGLNDPLSPSRLSPVSGLSGETCAAADDDDDSIQRQSVFVEGTGSASMELEESSGPTTRPASESNNGGPKAHDKDNKNQDKQ